MKSRPLCFQLVGLTLSIGRPRFSSQNRHTPRVSSSKSPPRWPTRGSSRSTPAAVGQAHTRARVGRRLAAVSNVGRSHGAGCRAARSCRLCARARPRGSRRGAARAGCPARDQAQRGRGSPARAVSAHRLRQSHDVALRGRLAGGPNGHARSAAALAGGDPGHAVAVSRRGLQGPRAAAPREHHRRRSRRSGRDGSAWVL